MDILKKLKETTNFVKSLWATEPQLGLVLGSGLGGFAQQIEVGADIPYSEIPNFPTSSVKGHGGQLVCGQLHGLPLVIMKGRVHHYEGYSMDQVIYPIRAMASLGIKTLILTNSAGGLNPQGKPGDLMVIEDHINLMGENPLRGPNLDSLGPRFPDMSQAYDPELRDQMIQVLEAQRVPHYQGVYCGVSGPSYETPAEIRFLQTIGGGAVGMSTVPETLAANHLGLRVGGVSLISNMAAGLHHSQLSHEEVTHMGQRASQTFYRFFNAFIKKLHR